MPTTQELPRPPLEGAGFFQEDTNVDTVEPEGQNMTAAQQKEEDPKEKGRKRAIKRRENLSRHDAEEMASDNNPMPVEKRVKFNIAETGETSSEREAEPLDSGCVTVGISDDVTTHRIDTGELGGNVEVPGLALPTSEDVETCIHRITSETQLLFSKWKETFSESEAFESFFPTRVDELLKEALALEENLKEKKEVMKRRLSAIASTLECFNNS